MYHYCTSRFIPNQVIVGILLFQIHNNIELTKLLRACPYGYTIDCNIIIWRLYYSHK